MLKTNVEYIYSVYIKSNWVDNEYDYWNYDYTDSNGDHRDVSRYSIKEAFEEFEKDASEHIKKNINKLNNLSIDIIDTHIDSSPFKIHFKPTEDIIDEKVFKESLDNIFNYEGVYYYDEGNIESSLCLIFYNKRRATIMGKSEIEIEN